MKRIFLLLTISILCLSFKAQAEDYAADISWFEKLGNNFNKALDGPDKNIFIPINTWHNRLAYDDDKIDDYNEMPWGLGYGVSRYDEDGDWHSVYGMVFEDSNHHPQTIFGYAFQKNWLIGDNPDFRVGAGLTVGLTQRQEYSYIPIPIPLPIAGLEYKKFAIQTTYIPGGKNNGNVLFTWLRYQI